MVPASPLVLPYADAPARWGIVCERNGPEVTITVPRPRRTSILRVIGALAFLAVLTTTILPMFGRAMWWVVLLAAIVSLGGVAADNLLNLPPLFKFSKPLVVELNLDSLTLRNYAPPGEEDPVRPRDQVYEVKFIPHSGNLVIHSRNMEMIEFRPCPDAAVLRWMADTLTAALNDAPFVTPARTPAPAPRS